MHPRPGNLREVAEQIEASTGLRVEIIGGSLVTSPTPRGKHAGTIRRLRVQIEPRLSEALAPYEMSSVAMPEDPDDYATPDLTVLPVAWDEDDSWLADPRDVALAVEVISQSEKAKDITDKNGWYARAGIAVLLVLDPPYRPLDPAHPPEGRRVPRSARRRVRGTGRPDGSIAVPDRHRSSATVRLLTRLAYRAGRVRGGVPRLP
ncbi:Uma2 family endonuclease [Streptomyces antibioticus]|uniref:Uma2 family endonuclease n=1 Tax=Streptomyces antibioticus TaxID=1890 RepID=UPI003D7549D9